MDLFDAWIHGFEWGPYRPPYHRFNEVSAAALDREKDCKRAFHACVEKYEKERNAEEEEEHEKKKDEVHSKTSDGTVVVMNAVASAASTKAKKTTNKSKAKKEVVFANVVPPSLHLTAHTWSTFRIWVEKNHPGWKVKRKEATTEQIENLDRKEKKTGRRGKSYFLSFSYLEGRVYKPPIKKDKKRAAGADETTSAPRDTGRSMPGAPLSARTFKKQKTSTTDGVVKKAATDMNPEEEDPDQHSKPAAKPTYMIPPPAGTPTLLFTDLPDQIQVQILSFCDVKDLNSLLFVSKEVMKVSQSDKVWEQPLKMMLIEFFGDSLTFQNNSSGMSMPSHPIKTGVYPWRGVICDPVTPLHERPDWLQSTSILRWILEERELSDDQKTQSIRRGRNTPFLPYWNKGYQAHITKNVVGEFLRQAYDIGFQVKAGRPLSTRHEQKKKRLDLLFTDQSSVREYYLRLGKLVFLANNDDLFEEQSAFCPHCVRSTMELPRGFKNFPKIYWPLVNLE